MPKTNTPGDEHKSVYRYIRHADARTCATALCRVIAPELFEGGGE